MEKVKISIIVPIYNAEQFLEKCLNSLINQTYQNLEIVCINDGSKDKSLSILKEYQKKDKRIIIIDQANQGVSEARNKGIKMATGEYICFCDADDTYKDNFVEVMYSTILKYKVDVVRCNYLIVDNLDKEVSRGNNIKYSNQVLDKKSIRDLIIPECLNGNIPCFTCLAMVKHSKINPKFKKDIAMMEDVVFYIELLLNIDSMYIIDDALYKVYFNQDGATNNIKNYKRNIFNIYKVNDYILDLLKQSDLLTIDNINNLNYNHLNAISDFLFKYYLVEKDITLFKEIRNQKYLQLIEETNLKGINTQRRLILTLIYKEKYVTLKVYCSLRKIIYKLKRVINNKK